MTGTIHLGDLANGIEEVTVPTYLHVVHSYGLSH
jgi:hypothetical protein